MADSYNSSDKAYRRSIATHATIRFIVCALLTIISLIPLYIILVNATRTHVDIQSNPTQIIFKGDLGTNFGKLGDPEIGNGFYTDNFIVWRGYLNSFLIAGGSTILTVVFSAFTAYGLTIYDFKLKKIATTFILAVMMVPTQIVSVGFQRFMIQLGLSNNYLPLILPAIAAPSVVFFMLQYMKASFPVDVVEASRIDGCGEFRTFVQIAMPIFKPAFAVQAIFAFVASWNNYYTPNMLIFGAKRSTMGTMPMMTAGVMSNLKLADYGVNYLAIVLSILPIIVVYLLLSKFIVKGVALGAVKG